MFELWRGGEFLGRFDEQTPVNRKGRRVGSAGVLLPAVDTAAWRGVWQLRDPSLPGSPILEHEMPRAGYLGERTASRDLAARQERVVEPLRLDEIVSLPEDERLHVRREDGTTIATRWIMMEEIGLRPGAAAEAGFPAEWSSAWLVTFVESDAS